MLARIMSIRRLLFSSIICQVQFHKAALLFPPFLWRLLFELKIKSYPFNKLELV